MHVPCRGPAGHSCACVYGSVLVGQDGQEIRKETAVQCRQEAVVAWTWMVAMATKSKGLQRDGAERTKSAWLRGWAVRMASRNRLGSLVDSQLREHSVTHTVPLAGQLCPAPQWGSTH